MQIYRHFRRENGALYRNSLPAEGLLQGSASSEVGSWCSCFVDMEAVMEKFAVIWLVQHPSHLVACYPITACLPTPWLISSRV